MGYTLVKFLDSVSAKRALFYLDKGEIDLPPVDLDTYSTGSEAVSLATGQHWFFDTKNQWRPVRKHINKTYQRKVYGGNENEITPRVKEIRVFSKKVSLMANSDIQLQAEVIGDDIFDGRVSWKVIPSEKYGTYITQGGWLHVGNYTRNSQIIVRVTSVADEEVFTDIEVSVVTSENLRDEIYAISIFPKQVIVGVGDSIEFTPVISGRGNFNDQLIWSVAAASDSLINEFGRLVIGDQETSQTIVVEAKSAINKAIVGRASVVVKPAEKAPKINSVSVFPKKMTVGPGCYGALAGLVLGDGEHCTDIIWSIEASSSQTVISREGAFYIGEDEPEGKIVINAVSAVDSSKSDSIVLTVSRYVQPTQQEILGIIVDPDCTSIYKGYNSIFQAQVMGLNIYDQRVKWELIENTSEYTSINSQGVLAVAEEEDSNSVIVKVSSVADPSMYALADVEILNNTNPMIIEGTGAGVSDIVVDKDKNLIIRYSDGTQRVLSNLSSKVYVPHVDKEDKILTFTIENEPSSIPAPIDLKVDLSDYALRSEVSLTESVIAQQAVGGVPEGKYYPKDTLARQIVTDMLSNNPTPPPVKDIFLAKGATFKVPESDDGFEQIKGMTKKQLIEDKLTTEILVDIDSVTEEGQYPAIAAGKEVELVKWNQASAPDFPTDSFEKVEKNEYNLYYLTDKVSRGIDYQLTFKEAEQ